MHWGRTVIVVTYIVTLVSGQYHRLLTLCWNKSGGQRIQNSLTRKESEWEGHNQKSPKWMVSLFAWLSSERSEFTLLKITFVTFHLEDHLILYRMAIRIFNSVSVQFRQVLFMFWNPDRLDCCTQLKEDHALLLQSDGIQANWDAVTSLCQRKFCSLPAKTLGNSFLK